MIRTAAIASLAASLLSAPVAAQEDDALRGVWQGRVGNQDVYACFDSSEDRGVYYYDRYRELIRLVPTGEALGFAESVGWDGPGDARWQIESVDQDNVAGTWREAERTSRIRLERLDWTGIDEFAGPCQSYAFLASRLGLGRFTVRTSDLDGVPYTAFTYVPPRHWQADGEDGTAPVNIESFAVVTEVRGDRTINAILGTILPRGNMMDSHVECFAMNIATHGTDGYYSQSIRPELITDRWVGAIESVSLSCGGAHGANWQTRRVFDRHSGEEIDTTAWLNNRALDREVLEIGEGSAVYVNSTDAFVEVILRYWQESEIPECLDAVRTGNPWDIGLARDGLALIPSLPHVAQACADTVVVPWSELTDFLTPEGHAARLSLEGSAQ